MNEQTGHGMRPPRLRPGYRLQWEPAQHSHVLLYPEGMIRLNDSAAAILTRCDGQTSLSDLIDALAAEYPGEATLAEDIREFIDLARQRGWIELR